MKKGMWLAIILIICLCGCQQRNPVEKDESYHFLEVRPLRLLSEQEINPQWKPEIVKQLQRQYELNEVEIEVQMDASDFQLCKVGYGTVQTYDGDTFPYMVNSDIIFWKSKGYYCICQINNKEIEIQNDQFAVMEEDPVELWTEGDFLLKVLPANQSILYTIGSRASFVKAGQKPVGPFTLVNSFYIPYFDGV